MAHKSISARKKNFIACCRDSAGKELSWGASGNFSMRIAPNQFMVTASGSHFSCMRTEHITRCAVDQEKIISGKRPSVEHNMHRAIYAARPDIRYIVHAHPVFSVLMISAENAKIDYTIIPEAEHYLGSIRNVPYIKAGTKKLAHAVGCQAKDASIIILKNHGIVALGEDFYGALCAVEAFEFIAKLNYYARIAKLKIPHLV